MENIIKKAIEGGYREGITTWERCTIDDNGFYATRDDSTRKDKNFIVLDHLFWQALGKACGWDENPNWVTDNHWITYGKKFHEINLTEGFEKAVEYLESIITYVRV